MEASTTIGAVRPWAGAIDVSPRLVSWLPAVCALVLPVGVLAYVVDPRLGLLALAALAMPLFVLSPQHAVLLLVAALPFDAVGSLGPPGTATVTRMLGVAVSAGWVVHVLLRRQRVRLGRPALFLFAYLVYAAVSLLWAEDRVGGIAGLQLMLQLFALYVVVVNLLSSWEALRRALDVLLLSTAVVAVLVLWQLPMTDGAQRATLRVGEEVFNHNVLAAALVLPVFAGLLLGRTAGGWWRLCAVVPVLGATLLTGSRGAVLAVLVGGGVLVVARPRALLGLAVSCAVVGVIAAAVIPHERLASLGGRYEQVAEDRASGRFDIWKVGVAMIEDRPLRGLGLANFQPAFFRYMTGVELDPTWARAWANRFGNRGAHNVYLQAIAELGIVGGVLLLAAMFTHASSAWAVFRRAHAMRDPRLTAIALSVVCTFAVLLTLCLNGDLLITKSAWVVFAFAQAVALAGRTPLSRQPWHHHQASRTAS